MGNTEDNKEVELKKIPRNPNMPIKDDEVEALLKKATEQISEKEKKAKLDLAQEKSEKTRSGNVKEESKRENVTYKSLNGGTASDKTQENEAKKQVAGNKIGNTKPGDKESLEKKETTGKVTDWSPESKTMKDKKASGRKLENDKTVKEQSVSKESLDKEKQYKKELDFQIEDDVYVTGKREKKMPEKNYNMTAGDVVGAVFEGVWTGIKLIVLVLIVTALVGFFMSRDMMIRGRSGEMLSKKNMNVAPLTLSTEREEKNLGKTWSETVKMEKLTLEADDGKILIAQKVVVSKGTNDWVVVLHGQNGKMDDIYDIGMKYAAEGYNVLMPDLRAHGESEGSFYGMGWLDRLDVINWIDVILEENPAADVIIHGVDLGADTALMLSGEPLKDSIKAIVAEGAYTSAWAAMKKEYKARHEDWPVFPMLHMMNPVMKVWAGYSLTEADVTGQVKKTDVPILLIHGQNDTYVTEDMTKELDAAIASEHEVLTIATGTHEDCRFAEPETYYSKVFAFAERYMK